jgi:hypothetical protein
MAGGRRLPPSMERLWQGELRRAHAIINIITNKAKRSERARANGYTSGLPGMGTSRVSIGPAHLH